MNSRFDDQRRPSHWTEVGDDIYGRHLSPVESYLDEIDNTPSLRTGLDRSSARPTHTAPGVLPSSAPGAPPSRRAA